MNTERHENIRKELAEMAPTLAKHKAGKAFTVPDSYFEELEGNILSRAQAQKAEVPRLRFLRPSRILAYAASMLLFTTMAWAAYTYIITPIIQRNHSEELVPDQNANQPFRNQGSDSEVAVDNNTDATMNASSGQNAGTVNNLPGAGTQNLSSAEGAGQLNSGANSPQNSGSATSTAGTRTLWASMRDSAYCQGEDAQLLISEVAGAVTYRVLLDDKQLTGISAPGRYNIRSASLATGAHRIEVLAYDARSILLERATASVTVYPMPVVDLGSDACFNTAQVLQIPASRNNDIRWQDGSRQSSLTVRQSGKYWVTLSNKDLPRCKSSDTVLLRILPQPADQLPEMLTLCNGEELRLSPRDTKTGYDYNWKQGKTTGATLFMKGLKPGVYSYSLEIGACEENYTETVQINVEDCGIEIPNVITPNGDGANDRFIIKNMEQHPQTYLAIFDRSGNKVFESNDYQNNWEAENCPNGTYFYILRMRKGPVSERSGTITVLR